MRRRLVASTRRWSTAAELPLTLTGHTASVTAASRDLVGFAEWEPAGGQTGAGYPESVSRWHSVWLDQ